MKIGIIGPSEDEILPFIEIITKKQIHKKAMLTFYSGQYRNIEVVALFCGVCKVNAAIATQILIDKFSVTHIIVTGVAGGIDKSLKIGDTVISDKVAYHDVDKGILTEYHPWMDSVYFHADRNLLEISKKLHDENSFNNKIVFGTIVTGEAFIDKVGREKIIKEFHPLCVDMETSAVAHVCYANEIPFIAIRSITDTEDKSGIGTFEENCEIASKNSINVLEKLLIDLSI